MKILKEQREQVEHFIFEKWVSGDDMSFLDKEDTHDKRSRIGGWN
ncbi:hypothetical protein R4Y45_06145 [Holzapfeliella sp. He02]|uniref:Uncharacterized protein n=1 Tax=Holzapfeliella saturejae TaxID=3082953 RepID=A0ABU8SHG4_9LACO